MEGRDHGAEENVPGPAAGAVDGEDEGDDGAGFSFPVPSLAADAFIVPVYPVFGRPMSPPPREPVVEEEEETETATVRVPLGRLLLEEREFRARQRERPQTPVPQQLQQRPDDEGGGDGELEGVPPESYCLWAPGQSTPGSPRRCRKSGSTGSVLRWRRISERLVRRSQSDGKEKFVFLNAGPSPHPPKDSEDIGGGGGGGSKDNDGRHGWSYYRKGGGGSGGRRKSYLPYKQELVGLFANVSGLRRSYHPF
ncbi:uncharacterized protein LOC102710750 [Oryza brachyantha]|uniref:uncharacterized protein LOC102710750 n=1 Tax=Oryza brachyantha TaxID=4533 RepID=UPI001ADA7CA7|nr:uncharacterized protein LOC102710750 [Oryza brachyantha]